MGRFDDRSSLCSFSALKNHSRVLTSVAYEKSAVSVTVSLKVIEVFFPPLWPFLRFFSLRLWFSALLLCMLGSVFLFIYDAWDSLGFLNI